MKYIIYDWCCNDVFNSKSFKTFDDAEMYLSEFLGDNYDTDRQEYEIILENQMEVA